MSTKRSSGSYHHGDLRRRLIAEAMQLLESGGLDAVSVREAARRAGVSPAAPFRHFPSRQALLSALAEEAIARLRGEIDLAIAAAPAGPLERFRAIGKAYLRWAQRHPAHFAVVSTAGLFDLGASDAAGTANDAIIAASRAELSAAAAAGQLVDGDLKLILVAGRAMVYGFARMRLDGHFPRWGLSEAESETMAEALVDFFVRSIERRP